MTARLDRPATRDGLFLWIMHRFAEVFEHHAVLKGGMALRLMECPRQTVDIDYVFVPFGSKKGVADGLQRLVSEIEDAQLDIRLHSKMVRAELRDDTTHREARPHPAPASRGLPPGPGPEPILWEDLPHRVADAAPTTSSKKQRVRLIRG